MTPWLSILLPAYQVQDYLEACATSILVQADAGVELVFVDDASQDDTAARIQALGRRDERVRLIRHASNLGVSAARNTLLDAARGDYLWFVDPDDLMEAGALAALKALITKHQPDLITCDFRSFEDATGQPRKPRYGHVSTYAGASNRLEHDRDALLCGLFTTGQLHPWSKIVRRAIWPVNLRFPAGRVFEDLAVYPRLALQVQSHIHVPEVWIGYRQRAGSALSAMTAAKLTQWMQALAGYAQELPLDASPALRLAVAHYTGRALARACARAGRVEPEWLNLWRSASPLNARELALAYWQAGRIGDWLRWRFSAGGRAALKA